MGWYLCNALHAVLKGSNPDKLWAFTYLYFALYPSSNDQARTITSSLAKQSVNWNKLQTSKLPKFIGFHFRRVLHGIATLYQGGSSNIRRHAPPSRPSTSHISKRWLYRKALLVTRLRNGTNIFRLERQGCSRQHNISAK